ncbi:MAG: Uma2 family endonuclease [Verrucomicrobiales bacterium]
MLDIPGIRRRMTRLSVDDYHRLSEMPVELLCGRLVDKVSKSPLHFATTAALFRLLLPQVPDGFVLRQEGPLTFADSEPEPDMAIVRGALNDYRACHPSSAEWVIEVAVTSLEIDRFKALIYAAAGVPEYWIVRPVERIVEVYRDPTSAGYGVATAVQPPEMLTRHGTMAVALDLNLLFPAAV